MGEWYEALYGVALIVGTLATMWAFFQIKDAYDVRKINKERAREKAAMFDEMASHLSEAQRRAVTSDDRDSIVRNARRLAIARLPHNGLIVVADVAACNEVRRIVDEIHNCPGHANAFLLDSALSLVALKNILRGGNGHFSVIVDGTVLEQQPALYAELRDWLQNDVDMVHKATYRY